MKRIWEFFDYLKKKDLPKIEKINWSHGEIITLLEFRKFLEENIGFIIDFDRDMQTETINHSTICLNLTLYSFSKEGNKYLEKTVDKRDVPFFIHATKKRVIIEPHFEYSDGLEHPLNITGKVEYDKSQKIKSRARFTIKLKGDFVLDTNGSCLDGNHLHGKAPTGNGLEGGQFESWFDIQLFDGMNRTIQ